MKHSFSPEGVAWLESQIEETLGECRQLIGSTSSQLFQVNQRFVLRVIDNPDWLAEETDIPEHETAALQEAAFVGIPAPKPIAYASEGIGFGVPVVLMSFLPGQVQLVPNDRASWLRALAQTLAQIHAHRAPELAWRYESWVNKGVLHVPEWTRYPTLWEQAIAQWLAPPPRSPWVFLHRDYHPCNVLWNHDEICGVVDWASACRGPAGVDVGHCRADLALQAGPEAAHAFLCAYQEAAPEFIHERYWDIDAILDMCLPAPSFYKPWTQFGLPMIPQEILNQRLDAYLLKIMESNT